MWKIAEIALSDFKHPVTYYLLSPVLKKVWCEYEYEYGLGVSMVWGVVFPGP